MHINEKLYDLHLHRFVGIRRRYIFCDSSIHEMKFESNNADGPVTQRERERDRATRLLYCDTFSVELSLEVRHFIYCTYIESPCQILFTSVGSRLILMNLVTVLST
jgi:hypothetical protein